MLWITIPATESFNETTEEFVYTKETTLQLEHSLVSLSKWESKWHEAFLSPRSKKTEEQILDYIRCMTITQNVDPEIYNCLTKENFDQIQAYIDNPMTATTFSDRQHQKPNREIVTNELIYYWMVSYNIPVEFEKWHLNRLLTLIRVCSIKNAPPKKMSKREIMSQNASLNAARRKALNSRG